jgi:hypothetical protein
LLLLSDPGLLRQDLEARQHREGRKEAINVRNIFLSTPTSLVLCGPAGIEKAIKLAQEQGWAAVSMKQDWSNVFAFQAQ